MSGLAKDAAAFKSVLSRQDYTSWHSQPPPPGTTANAVAAAAGPPPDNAAAGSSSSSSKKKRPKASTSAHVLLSEWPADTGTGSNINTQLLYAVKHLKSTPNPMRLQDIAIVTNTPLDSDMVLLEKFKAHDRIQWDPKTDLYSYKHDFNFRTKADLLTEIRRQTHRGGGIPVRSLKESWKEAPQAIEEFEKAGDVLVTRTAKDGQLRMVFWNDLKASEEKGGMPIEKEFLDLWHSLKTPNDADLVKALASEGLAATQAEESIPKGPATKKKGRKSAPRQRQVKITNTHLKGVDLSKDYVK
ncbi:hypothetical protein HWV62_10136 [Athelia sp. TMB]|nr:hypothetical protein HWV62_10136 [Athelia sp. TMB]